MRHIQMTCENHPNLRWSCKEVAVNANGRYNHSRNIFFMGTVEDIAANRPENMNDECKCSPSLLIALEKFNAEG